MTARGEGLITVTFSRKSSETIFLNRREVQEQKKKNRKERERLNRMTRKDTSTAGKREG